MENSVRKVFTRQEQEIQMGRIAIVAPYVVGVDHMLRAWFNESKASMVRSTNEDTGRGTEAYRFPEAYSIRLHVISGE